MPLFPMFADLSGREVLVVGGGEVATRKIEALLHAGARVQVHAKALGDTLADWLEQGRLIRLEGEFDPGWLDRVWLLVAATDDREFNRRLAAEAGKRYRLANVVDDAELSTFQIPSIVDRGLVQVAISSGGAAPMLARRLRERLEALLDASLGDLAALFARHRVDIRRRLPHLAQRRRWFDEVLDGPVPALLEAGKPEAAEQAFQDALQHSQDIPRSGSVLLVDAGHGDPGLLTLKALRALNQADVLVCDAGVDDAVSALARRDATRLPRPADHELAKVLARHASAGHRVVYLMSGDLLRSGARLCEELQAQGIVCASIPDSTL